jgi:hypothetical protein
MIQGGKSFEIKVAKTESMKTKDAVKNIMNVVRDMTALILYSGRTKHN